MKAINYDVKKVYSIKALCRENRTTFALGLRIVIDYMNNISLSKHTRHNMDNKTVFANNRTTNQRYFQIEITKMMGNQHGITDMLVSKNVLKDIKPLIEQK